MLYKSDLRNDALQLKSEKGLEILLTTERLIIRSLLPEDEKNCLELFQDQKVMEKYWDGKPKEISVTQKIFERWLTRFKKGDPYSAYTVLLKDTRQFIGIFTVGHSKPGESEVAYLFDSRFWQKGYGKEAAKAVMESLVPSLMQRSYYLENKPLKTIVATARPDNPASVKILKRIGFKPMEEIFKYGSKRIFFSLSAKQVRNRHLAFLEQLDRKKADQLRRQIQNEGVSVTDEQLANSAFGQGSFAAKRLLINSR